MFYFIDKNYILKFFKKKSILRVGLGTRKNNSFIEFLIFLKSFLLFIYPNDQLNSYSEYESLYSALTF